VEALQERIEHLSKSIDTRDEEIRRRDTIIMTLSQRIPELEAPASLGQASWPSPETRDAPETATEGAGKDAKPEDQAGPQERRSWWRRIFEG
jgi:hypothetical protein